MQTTNTSFFSTAFVLVAALAAAPAWAVNKCTLVDGRVVYQDAHCGNEVKTTEAVKTWVSSGIDPSAGGPRSRDVVPNLKLAGPVQAKGLLDLYRRWADADKLARKTGRIALAGPAANLQSLQREAEAVSVPECLVPASKALTMLITKSTEAIIEFMGKQELTNMVYEIVDRPKLIPAFENAVSTARCG